MFDFWKEVIINDAKRLEEVAGKLRVTRCADYDPKHVVDGIVYKTVAREGKCAELKLASLVGSAVRRAQVILGLPEGHADSEFARPWSVFKKTFIVEFATLAELKAALVEACANHIGVVEGDKLVLVDPKVSIKVVLEEADGEAWKPVAVAKDAIVANVVPAGTGEWILENLRFPTHVNTRVAAPNADEMPIMGGKYTQYAFEYAVPKRGFHGQGAVGQAITSVTHHVFYVLDTIAADALFAVLGEVKDIDAVEPAVEE